MTPCIFCRLNSLLLVWGQEIAFFIHFLWLTGWSGAARFLPSPGPARLAKGFSEPWKKNWSFNWPALEPSWKYS
jgi:hypothetical protein